MSPDQAERLARGLDALERRRAVHALEWAAEHEHAAIVRAAPDAFRVRLHGRRAVCSPLDRTELARVLRGRDPANADRLLAAFDATPTGETFVIAYLAAPEGRLVVAGYVGHYLGPQGGTAARLAA